MGKKWDAFVPQPIFWKEVFRVLKHGGHVLCFFGTRTYDVGVLAMRLAGFEIRDCLQFLHGVGFPKGQNISMAIEGKGMSEESDKWKGWSTQLKPANEPIVLARKPLQEGMSIADNVLANGTGGINIGACRISHNEEQKTANRTGRADANVFSDTTCGIDNTKNNIASASPDGRFPANVILQHHEECECIGTKNVKGSNCKPSDIGKGRDGNFSKGIYGDKQSKVQTSHTDENGFEQVGDWVCHEDCPVRILDEQSGISKSSGGSGEKSYGALGNSVYGKFANNKSAANIGGLGDIGGASRFYYTSKASKKERNYGLPEGEINKHPTVKSIAVMKWLIKLITPVGGKCLDPFMGSGTTGVAIEQDGYCEFYGIEMEEESFNTSKLRCTFAADEFANKVKEQNEKPIQGGLF